MQNKFLSILRKIKLPHITGETYFGTFLLGLLLTIFILYAYKNALFFEGIPINGAFQHFNPLRRLFDGEIPGVDFIVFHGTGLTLVFAPIYAILGQNLFASEFSRFFLGSLSIFLVFFCFLKFVVKKDFLHASLVSVILVFLFHYSGIFWLLDPFGPTYSSLGVRTFFPLFGFFILYYSWEKIEKNIISLAFALGLTAAVVVFFSTEQGIALFLSILGGIFFFLGKTLKEKIALLIIYVVSFFTLLFIILGVYALGDISKPLTFLFKDIPIDQIWYFGAPPNRILTSIFDLYVSVTDIIIIKQLILFLLSGIVLLLFSFWKKFGTLSILEKFFLWTLFFYGIISISSNLGMYSPHYFEVSTRIGLIIILFLSYKYIRIPFKEDHSFYGKLFILSFMGGLLIFGQSGILSWMNTITETQKNIQISGKEKVSGVYLAKGIWDNYISRLESVMGPAGEVYHVDAKYSDDIWKDGVAMFSNINAKESNLKYLSTGDQVVIDNHEHFVTKIDREAGTFQIEGEVAKGSVSTIEKKTKGDYMLSVSTSPFYSTAETTNPDLIGFINGVKIEADTVSLLLETHFDLQVGDAVIFSDGQKSNIESINGNIIIINSTSLQIQPYLHGYPQKIKIISSKDINNIFSGSVESTLNIFGFRITNFQDLSKYEAGDILRADSGDECLLRHIEGGNIFCSVDSLGFFKNTRTLLIQKANSYIGKNDIWSTYAGIAEEHYSVFQPSGTDYLIHILGPKNRKKYLEDFKAMQPKYVLTIRPDYMAYERWLQLTTWGFYEEILRKYDLLGMTAYSLIWEKRKEPSLVQETAWEKRAVDPNNNQITIPTPYFTGILAPINKSSTGLTLVVRVHYRISNPYESVPILGSSPRYLITPLNVDTHLPISLPPYEESWEFPLYIKNLVHPVILQTSQINPIGFIHGNFVINQIDYKYIRFPENISEALFLNKYSIIDRSPLLTPEQ